MTFYIVLSLSAFLISLIGTKLTILALRKRTLLLDIPNARSNHKVPVPKGGGFAVVTALIICLLVARLEYSIVLFVLILAAVSLLDDLIGVPAPVRLLIQIIAVVVALSGMPNLLPADGLLPPWAGKMLIGIMWVWFINLFNFMDGIDGISAAEMISIGLGLCFIASLFGDFPSSLAIHSLITASAAFGFLWWNRHPAKIFMGDVGSVPIGFLLGYLLLIAFSHGYYFAALILPAYYLSDGTITLLNRLWRREKIWQAHSSHYYQKAVRKGMPHDVVVRYIFVLNLVLVLLATLSTLYPSLGTLYTAVAYLLVAMVLDFFAQPAEAPHGP